MRRASGGFAPVPQPVPKFPAPRAYSETRRPLSRPNACCRIVAPMIEVTRFDHSTRDKDPNGRPGCLASADVRVAALLADRRRLRARPDGAGPRGRPRRKAVAEP